MLIDKLKLDILDSLGNKDIIELGYIDAEPLYNSETRLSRATAIYNLGLAVANLSKSTYSNVTAEGYVELNSETATAEVSSQYSILGKCSFNVSDLNLGTPVNGYWKSIGLLVNATPLFNSETQVAYLTAVNDFGQGFCGLSDGKYGDGLEFNEARVEDSLDINAIIGEG